MRRLHCEALPEKGGRVTLDDAARRHARVLRLAVGDALVLFDGSGHETNARIVSLEPELICAVEELRKTESHQRRVVLVQCLAKGDKVDEIVRAVTEAGVAEVRLADSTRGVMKWDEKKKDAKLERLVRVAREAARQSGRATVPEVFSPLPLSEVMALAPPTAIRVALVPGARATLFQELMKEGVGREVWMVVGSEGGIGEGLGGWTAASIGSHVFRVEHAGLVGVALAMAVR